MAAVFLSPIGNGGQYFTTGGLPVNGGFLNTYQAGTTTPQATFTTSAGNVANPVSIPLGTGGRPPAGIWLTSGIAYDFILTDSSGAQIGPPMLNITGIGDGVTGIFATIAQLAASAGASLIGWIQSGTGAVARTVQSKLRDTVSVKDFGAVGDGATDDTAAIQSAINYAQATYTASGFGVKVIVPAGKYKLTQSLQIGTSAALLAIRFEGAGKEATKFLYYGAAGTDGIQIGRTDSPGEDIVEHSTIGGFSVVRMFGTGGKAVAVRQIRFSRVAEIFTGASDATLWEYGVHLWDWPGTGYWQTIWSKFENIHTSGASNIGFYAGISNAGNQFNNIDSEGGAQALYAIAEYGFWNTWIKARAAVQASAGRALGGLLFGGGSDGGTVNIFGLECENGFSSPKANIVHTSAGRLRIYGFVSSGNPFRMDNPAGFLVLDDSNQYGTATYHPNTIVNGATGWRMEGFRVPKNTFAIKKTTTSGVNNTNNSLLFNGSDGLIPGFDLKKIRIVISGADASQYVMSYRVNYRAADGTITTTLFAYPYTTIFDGVVVTNGVQYFDPVGVWEIVNAQLSGKAELTGIEFLVRTGAATTTASFEILLAGAQDLK